MIASMVLMLLAAGDDPSRLTGGVVAPASLPSGTNALFGYVGAPEVAVGYRQGFEGWEFEARGAFNLFKVSALVEAGVKLGVYDRDRLKLAPVLALGVEFNSGARYFDVSNFGFVGLRPRLGLNGSYAFTDTISGLAQLEVPWSFGLSAQGFQLTPLVGAGAEFHLGGGFSMLLSGHVGFDATREPLGVTQWRAAWAARIGVGYRIF